MMEEQYCVRNGRAIFDLSFRKGNLVFIGPETTDIFPLLDFTEVISLLQLSLSSGPDATVSHGKRKREN